MIKVSNMTSSRGNKAPNQFIIRSKNKIVFQSYESIIAIKENDTVLLDQKYWNFSDTTSKYRNLFLNEKKVDTLKKINSGEYKLRDLNRKPVKLRMVA
jgi:hypothetical protein